MSERYRMLGTDDAPTCPGSSGAPPLRLGRSLDNRPLARGLSGNDIPDVTAGQNLHPCDYSTPQGSGRGFGASRTSVTANAQHGESQVAGWRVAVDHFWDCFIHFVLFYVVGPPWTLAAFVLFILITINALMSRGPRGFQDASVIVMPVSLHLAVMQRVAELAYFLVPPDERGWPWAALLALSYFFITLVMKSSAVLAWSKRPRGMLQLENWLLGWAETLVHKLERFWRLYVKGQGEGGLLVKCIRELCSFLECYGLYYIVGAPWTWASLIVFLVVFLNQLAMLGKDLFVSAVVVSFVCLRLFAMHGITDMAKVLVPPDDRGWQWTAVLALSCLFNDLLINSCLRDSLSPVPSMWSRYDVHDVHHLIECMNTLA